MRSDAVPDPPELSDGRVSLRLRRVDDAASIADAVTDAPLGLVNVQFRDDRLATLAYSVFPEARGRGIAGRAVALISTWCFTDLGLAELRLEIDPANHSSRRVAEKGGWVLMAGVTSSEGELVFRRDAPSSP